MEVIIENKDQNLKIQFLKFMEIFDLLDIIDQLVVPILKNVMQDIIELVVKMRQMENEMQDIIVLVQQL